MGIGIEYIYSLVQVLSHMSLGSKTMTGLPGGDRMCKLIHRMQRVEQNVEMLERRSGVKRPQVRGQRVFAGRCRKNNNSKHK